MTTAVATIDKNRQPRSVLVAMSSRYGMEPAAFEATLRNTVVPANVSKEQFAAFLLVAREHNLNPITKEIYAFPARGGGIQPIVSIDGWMRLINSHPDFDGLEFVDVTDGEGQLAAITARIWRKDRNRPTEITEYMAECRRDTEVWKKWPARMLRHKAAIQCARYAFGFAGIADPDEYERGSVIGQDEPKAEPVSLDTLKAEREPAPVADEPEPADADDAGLPFDDIPLTDDGFPAGEDR